VRRSPIGSASAPARSDKWRLDKVVASIEGERRWLWRAVDQNGCVLEVLIQRLRDTSAAQRLMRKHLKSAVTPPRVMIADKLRSCGAARAKMNLRVEHRQQASTRCACGTSATPSAIKHIWRSRSFVRPNDRFGEGLESF
jgi:putative transposase